MHFLEINEEYTFHSLVKRENYRVSILNKRFDERKDTRNYRDSEAPEGDLAKEEASGRMCYSSDDLRRFLVQTKRSWARRYPDLGSLADGHNLNRLVGSEAWGLGLTYNNRSCSRVQ